MNPTAPQDWDAAGWKQLRRPTGKLARCRHCKQFITFPDAVDGNGKHHPVFNQKVWRDGDDFWHEACATVPEDAENGKATG